MKRLTTAILTCGILGIGVWQAAAAAQLRLSDGTTTVTVVDEGPGDAALGVPGQVEYIGPVGPNWFLDITIGTGNPLIGSSSAPSMDITTFNNSSAAGTLTIDFTQDGFTGGGAADMQVGGVTAGQVTYQLWVDPANAPFAKTTLIGAMGPIAGGAGGAFSSETNGVVPQANPYSLTMETVIQHFGAGHTGLDAFLSITPPACSCTLTFNSPTSITNCPDDTIPDVTASQDCGAGPVTVPVTLVSASTNGTCPQVITRSYTATDNCGVTYPFTQTITVNCKPDCTITPSVTTALVGSTNTASVANAGPGATYVWSISNGSIVSGQGTATLTWKAGTNTNNPVTIFVTVTAATGCQSACSASIKLTSPPPPPPPFGKGDTATIGFWHNKNGQGLILNASNPPALANWMATNFPCLFSGLAGKTNGAVAALFMTDFGVSGMKTDAQIMAVALASYFTSTSLGGGTGPKGAGFNQTPGGTGAKLFNIGSNGAFFGVPNNTSITILQMLQAASAWRCAHPTTAWPSAINDLFDSINQGGDIT